MENEVDKNRQSSACNASQMCRCESPLGRHIPGSRIGPAIEPLSTYLREWRREARVWAALRAACERLDAPRRAAARCAWLESARREAPERPSLLRARVVARARLLEGRLRRVERCLRLCF